MVDQGDAEASAEQPAGPADTSEVVGQPRRRRQERAAGRPRPYVHKVRVSVEQEEQLVARAIEHGNVSIPRLLVESALAGGADAARAWRGMAGELFRVSALLGRVGVNVNQIARATNATLETQPQTMAAMEAVVRVCDRVEALLVDLEAELGGRAGGRAGGRVGGGGR